MLPRDCLAPLWCTMLQNMMGSSSPITVFLHPSYSTLFGDNVNNWNVLSKCLGQKVPFSNIACHIGGRVWTPKARLSHSLSFLFWLDWGWNLMLRKHPLCWAISSTPSLQSILFWDRVSLNFPGRSCICNLPASLPPEQLGLENCFVTF